MKSADDLALGENRCGLLGSGSLVDLQRERALLIEAQGINAVNDNLADQRGTERPQEVTVAIPRNRDDDDVSTCSALLIARTIDGAFTSDAHTKFIRSSLRTRCVARSKGDPMPGHRQTSRKATSLLTGATEHTDLQTGHIREVTGVGCLRIGG